MTKFWIFFVCVFGITMGLSLTKSQWNCNFLEALKCSFCKITVVRCDSVKVTVNSNKQVLVHKVFNAFDICLVFGFSLRFSISIHFLLWYFWEYVHALTSRCNFQQFLNREPGIYYRKTLMSYGFFLCLPWIFPVLSNNGYSAKV
jgi:hypothetical protein